MRGLYSHSREYRKIFLRDHFSHISQILEGLHFGANTCRACIRTRANTGKNSWRIIYVLVSCQGVLCLFGRKGYRRTFRKFLILFLLGAGEWETPGRGGLALIENPRRGGWGLPGKGMRVGGRGREGLRRIWGGGGLNILFRGRNSHQGMGFRPRGVALRGAQQNSRSPTLSSPLGFFAYMRGTLQGHACVGGPRTPPFGSFLCTLFRNQKSRKLKN